MNVYEKLNEARISFQNGNIKKSGKNTYAGYTYYELADILPTINKLGKELKFTCVIEFTNELATLTFIDLEKPEDKIIFTSPMSDASLKGCHAVQNLGAVETYIKRYLYQNCFEIVEGDALDMTRGKEEPVKKSAKKEDPELNELIVQVGKAIETAGFNEKQISYANWCIENKNKEGLKKIVSSLVEKEIA